MTYCQGFRCGLIETGCNSLGWSSNGSERPQVLRMASREAALKCSPRREPWVAVANAIKLRSSERNVSSPYREDPSEENTVRRWRKLTRASFFETRIPHRPRDFFFRPCGASSFPSPTHGSRRGLRSAAASRLSFPGDYPRGTSRHTRYCFSSRTRTSLFETNASCDA